MTVHDEVRKEWEPRDLPTSAPPRWPGLTRRRVLVAVAAFVVLAAGIAVMSFPAWYRPLGQGSVSGLNGGRAIVDADFDRGFVIGYQDRTYAYGTLSLRNDGRLPVRIERVGRPRDEFMHSLVEPDPERTMLSPPNVYGGEGPLLQPFTLGAGEERAVEVALWMDDCEFNGNNSFSSIVTVPVRYRILGMARTEWIDLGEPWTVRAPDAGGCPRTAPTDAG